MVCAAAFGANPLLYVPEFFRGAMCLRIFKLLEHLDPV
jgi:hypothetical protein